jgi:hypothetical protein
MADSGIWPNDFAWGPAAIFEFCLHALEARTSNYIYCHRRLISVMQEAYQATTITPQPSWVAIGTVAALR